MYAHCFEQAGVHEVRLRIAGDIADLQIQVFAGGVHAVGRVHAVDLEQVLVGAGAVERNVLHVERTAVLRTVGAGVRADGGVGRHKRAEIAIRTRRLGDVVPREGSLARLLAVNAHGLQAQGGKLRGLVDVDDIAAGAVRAQRQA
ncbi:hypothetical protein D3C72_1672360 [compost metagenome]